jgi:hypothetical protein
MGAKHFATERIKLLSRLVGEPLALAAGSGTLCLRIMSIISAAPDSRPFGRDPNVYAFSPYRTETDQALTGMWHPANSEEES